MSVTVSHVANGWTRNADLWAHDPHCHNLDKTDYEVPSLSEHQSLASRVSDTQRDISKLETKAGKHDQSIQVLNEHLSHFASEIHAVDARLKEALRALNETGQLATAFKTVTDQHLGSIQKVADAFSSKIRDAEQALKVKTDDGLSQIQKSSSTVFAKIQETERILTTGVQKCKDETAAFGTIKEQAIVALKNAAALVQKQLSEYVEKKTAHINSEEQIVSKAVESIQSSKATIVSLETTASRLEGRLQNMEKERIECKRELERLQKQIEASHSEAICKLAIMEQKYRDTLASCQDALGAANYFRAVNRSFLSRLWWCLTGNCKERKENLDECVAPETFDDQQPQ